MTLHFRQRLLVLAFLLAALHCNACLAASITLSERASLTEAVDQLCSWSAMARQGDLREVEHFGGEWVVYSAKSDLLVEGRRTKYVIRFDSRFRVKHFMPAGFDLSEIGLGYDTLKNSRPRRICVDAVTRFNKALGWKSVVGPYVQRVGSNYIVTFETVTAEEQKRANYEFLDPYVSFLVTPKGTVFGGFWGA
jgi:hypothetical protein